MARNNNKNIKFPEPQVIEGSINSKDTIEVKASRGEANTSVRRNRASTISRTDKYRNIEGGVIPFIYGGGYGKYTSNISIKDTIILCQKAYYNFSIFRNTIDLMTEFSCSPIYFTGGNEQSRKFFQAWGDRVNLWKLQDMFFREFFRSGNVFLYKLNAQFTKQDMRVLTDLITTEARTGEIPIRYIILNPADIQALGSASFISPQYVKVLNDFEMKALTNPDNEQDKELAQRVKNVKDLKNTSNMTQTNQYMIFELDPERFVSVFYKKQDYEPFSVPMGFPVLEDINWKQELKNMDMAISRTIQQAVLLVTMGNDEVGMPTKEQIGTLRKIFENESVGRTNLTRIYTRLMELGILTPEEGVTAIETGRLPLPDESIDSQKEFKKLQEDGLYQPLLNKPQQQQTGRPAGTGVPQTTKAPRVTPTVQASETKPKINADLIAKNLIKFDNLVAVVETTLKEKYDRKRLTKEQKEIIRTIAETIATNEVPKDWENKINDYINKPVQLNVNMNEINEIAAEYGLDYKTAILLYHSKIESNE
jgi:hypothetical protein